MNLMESILETLKKEVVPATGCTEPVAIALAAAEAAQLVKDQPSMKLTLKISPNVFKNGMGVGIPGCPERGLDMAGALGLALADSHKGLKLLEDVNETVLAAARTALKEGRVQALLADTDERIYIEAVVTTATDEARAVIAGRHDHFQTIELNGNIVHQGTLTQTTAADPAEAVYSAKIKELVETIEQIPAEQLAFLMDGLTMNESIAQYGLENRLGMGVGATLNDKVKAGILSQDLMNLAMILTASASDARMAGVNMPVMSSNGSGNNGLTAVLPLAAYNALNPVEKSKMAKALAISHIVNCYIKKRIGRLSSLCGCSIAAATGSGVALSWLMDGSYESIENTIQNMIADVSGMICDGAKVGCALKLSTSASVAVKYALLGSSHCVVPGHNGIIGTTAEETIENLGRLSVEGMKITDRVILDIMSGMTLGQPTA